MDTELLRSVYHTDAIENHGDYQGDAEGFIKYLQMIYRTMYVVMRHLLGNTTIEIEGNFARVETYFSAGSELSERVDGQHCTRIHDGRYLDLFEKRDGEWRIAVRVVITDWKMGGTCLPIAPQSEIGTRDTSDPSYIRPLMGRPDLV